MKIFRKCFSNKEKDEKREARNARLKAGGSLIAGGALGMAIPVVAANKLEKEAGSKIHAANKRIAQKRGLEYGYGKGLGFVDSFGPRFTGPINKLKEIQEASKVSERYAKKVNDKAIKNMKKANAASLAATALGAAGAVAVAYKHHKNKKKEDGDKEK